MMKSSKDTNTSQNLKRSFHKLGHRFTNQRASIWQLFSNAPNGYTIQDAAGVLKKKGIGPATVYRTVKTLQKLGRLHWVHEKNGEHRFVARYASHSHMLACRSCGLVVEFESCNLTLLEKLLELETGFRIKGHDLELYGLCPECRSSMPSN
jgi:Fe2+ or Zn2+ uptake regulation protein